MPSMTQSLTLRVRLWARTEKRVLIDVLLFIEAQWTFHRGELQKLFLEHIRHPERIHMSKRLASYAQSKGPDGRVELRFHDGSTALCDVMVGADGIKSQVRAAMYTQLADAAQNAGRTEEAASLRSHINAVFSGSSVYRGLLEREPVTDGNAKQSSYMTIVSCTTALDTVRHY